ncbi:inositol phosphorylceramide synthase [Paenibacillus marchantiophytorum]|uniref:Inositol phosphorylceramide synthase n=1 Tax=Paenibacillus marchantiophytorum TaxID=1619310 RepID=A0ABQ1EXN4_9BACL|nr:phosphatase PAP2 family protein [Paenibacillus marchantiophytorum]GFZ91269.1 inositol phosphorylceramide synthase [Paenibacillus marchantiophytorum]
MGAEKTDANNIQSKLGTYLPLLWLFSIPVLNVFYGRLNNGSGDVGNLMTDLDNLIPFIPVFIIPYLIWYPFIFGMLIVMFLKDRAVYYRSLIALCAGLISCYLIYATYQTTVPRPPLIDDSWLIGLVKLVYATDKPFNCFPSIHVLTSYIVLKASYRCSFERKARTAIVIAAWSIIISTLFVKQHAILDVAGAILLSEALVFTLKLVRFSNRKPSKEARFHEL